MTQVVQVLVTNVGVLGETRRDLFDVPFIGGGKVVEDNGWKRRDGIEMLVHSRLSEPCIGRMTRTHKKVSSPPESEPIAQVADWTPVTAALAVEEILKMLGGRWKLLILFQLFGGQVKRFSELEKAIPAVTQKMLAQQLRQLEKDRIVNRKVHPEVPPKVEYSLTAWGQSLCPVLDALLKWTAAKKE